MYEIRFLKFGEEEEFIKLKQLALTMHPTTLIEGHYNPPVSFVTNQIAQGDNCDVRNVVLSVDGELMGMCQLMLGRGFRKHKTISKNKFVLQNEKTRGQKYGTKFWDFVIPYLKNLGYEEMQVQSTNPHWVISAVNYGFEIQYTEPNALKLENETYLDSVMTVYYIKNWVDKN